jgi:SAM-dependent methyltransferase
MNFPKWDYKEYPKTLPPDDFWGQVRRTVMGKPISESQIKLIVDAIKSGLDFKKDDCLLDIACGNGALSRLFFHDISEFLGVDNSEYLISVALANFARPPEFDFMLSGAAEYVRAEQNPDRFTKALCYGSFSFFTSDDAFDVLLGLSSRFKRIKALYLGNLPDKDRAQAFYPADKDYSEDLSNHASQIGIWRSRKELEQLAAETGWRIRFQFMPNDFFAAHYRFDAVLEPLDSSKG